MNNQNQGNLFEGLLGEDSGLLGSKEGSTNPLHKWFVNIQEFRDKQDTSNISPNPSVFSKEVLSKKPGMEWLDSISISLFYPYSGDVSSQLKELIQFKDQLKTEAFILEEDFCCIFPSGYKESLLALDTETTGLDTRVIYDYDGNLIHNTKLVGISIASSDERAYYLPIKHTGEDGILNWDLEIILKFLEMLHQEFTIIYHNAQYDREVLALNGMKGFRPFPYFFDTQLLDFLYDVNFKTHGLKYLAETKLKRKMVEINELFIEIGIVKHLTKDEEEEETVSSIVSFDRLPATNALVYACSDALNTFGLFKWFSLTPDEDNIFIHQYVPLNIDHKNVDVLRNLYRVGLPINFRYYYFCCLDLNLRITQMEDAIHKLVGRHWDIGSPQQLSKILFDEFNIPPLPEMERSKPTKKNPEGLYSTKEDVLDQLYEKYPDYPILKYIVEYRKLGNILSKIMYKAIDNSYVDALIPYLRVFLQYSQTVIPTGRISSSSSKGKERVVVNETKTGKITYNYKKGPWTCGFNSQGINNEPMKMGKARRIIKLPVESLLDLDQIYPVETYNAFYSGVAGLKK